MKYVLVMLAVVGISYAVVYAADPPKGPTIVRGDVPKSDDEQSSNTSDIQLPLGMPKSNSTRAVYVQITDDEYKRLDLVDIFEKEFPQEFAATGASGIDLNAFFGISHYAIRPAGGVNKARRAGYLVPLQLVTVYGNIMKGDSGWDTLTDSPKPQWLEMRWSK